jgi:hypothetical protein
VPVFCRHNRFTAECPICAKGTVLDPNLKPSRSRSAGTGTGTRRKAGGGARTGAAAAQMSRGVFAAAGPYDDGREVRLEKVPGGLRLAAWHAGTLVREAPVVALDDLPGLLAEAAERELIELPALNGQPATAGGGYGASPGRSGDLRDELRVERLDAERLRIARWVMRPNRGWELQEAPVLLPAGRFVEALESAAAQGVLASESEG